MVYYLKYRPQILEELDNESIVLVLQKYLARATSFPHAFIFTGNRGTGKTSTARIIAKSINCKSGKTRGSACGKCSICQSIAIGNNLDVLEIDAASNRGIDEIRELRERIKLAPTNLTYKVYIIDEVHMLTAEAFNALLKTLEEPPRHAVFILATTEAGKVPDTILSRCVRLDFGRANDEDIIKSLKRIVGGENLKVEESALLEIAKLADGSFRDASKMLEELALNFTNIKTVDVVSYAKLTDVAFRQNFLKFLKEKRTKELLLLTAELTVSGKNLKQFFLEILKELETLLVQCFSQKIAWDKEELIKAIDLLSGAFAEIKNAPLPALPFELAVIEYCSDGNNSNLPASSVEPANETEIIENTGLNTEKWQEILEKLKPVNHSIVGVLRSCKPVSFGGNILTIEAAFKFHAEKLAEPKIHELLAKTVRDVLGKDVRIEIATKKRN